MTRFAAIIIIALIALHVSSPGQINIKKNYFPVWTFHQDSIKIHGISLGFWSLSSAPRITNTNGLKLELIGIGLLFGFLPRSPIVDSDSAFNKLREKSLSEKINGLNLSTSGTACDCLTNGILAGTIGQISFQVNGISATFLFNFVEKNNGIMAAVFFNEAYYMNGMQIGFVNSGHKVTGLQIGLFNRAEKIYGIQIGIWNVNQKQKLPVLNWNFE